MSVVLSGTVVRVRVLQPVLGASEAFTEQTGNILPTKIEKKTLWLITDPNETEHRLCWKLHPSVLMLHSVANGNFYSWSKVGFWWTVHSLTVVLLCIWVQNLVISDLNYPPHPPHPQVTVLIHLVYDAGKQLAIVLTMWCWKVENYWVPLLSVIL